MPYALQQNCGFFTAGAAGTGAVTPMTGDTFNVANFSLSSQAYLDQVWANGASTDFLRIRSPRMHDANQGLRLAVGGVVNVPLLPWELDQPLYPSDTPTVELDETAAATGAIAAIYHYQDLPGVNPRYATWEEISSRVINVSGVSVALGAIGAIGAYSAGAAINSSFDNFEAGADYALLGYEILAARLAIAIQGQDTGNLKIGGPGLADGRTTRDWFVKAGKDSGQPYIPIIAANNKGSTLVFQTDNAASAATVVTLIMAELR
jgi:hypothetical protein